MSLKKPSTPILLGGIVIGALTIWLASHYGIWYYPLAATFVWSWIIGRPWPSLTSSWLMVMVGFALPLIWQSFTMPIASTARVVASIMGFDGANWLVFSLTGLLAILMATAGSWLALALKAWFVPVRSGYPASRFRT